MSLLTTWFFTELAANALMGRTDVMRIEIPDLILGRSPYFAHYVSQGLGADARTTYDVVSRISGVVILL